MSLNGTSTAHPHQEPTELLSEPHLRQISKSLTTLIPTSAEAVDENLLRSENLDSTNCISLKHCRKLQTLLHDVLCTARTSNLSLAHGSAALNALCGFLELCSKSSIPQIAALCYKSTTWIKASSILLQNSENHKPKPMRRLLLILTDILLKNPAEDVTDSLIAYATCTATHAICMEYDLTSLKPAIHLLEHFLRKDVVTASYVVLVAASAATIGQNNAQKGLSLEGIRGTVISQVEFSESIEMFTLYVLGWVQYPDCAPAVGRLLSTFFRSLADDHTATTISLHQGLPLWVSPVQQALEKNPGLLELFENYILPCLVRLNTTDTTAFLSMLPFDDIQNGKLRACKDTELQLYLSVAANSKLRESHNRT